MSNSPPQNLNTLRLRGLTLKGNGLSQCILDGRKTVENRTWVIAPGWIAIHTGIGKFEWSVENALTPDEFATVAREAREKCPVGAIAGLAFVSHALPVELVDSPWAIGPICNIIEKTAFLVTPIPRRGQLGLWNLTDEERAAIDEQLPSMIFKETGHNFPPNPAALAAAIERRNAARLQVREAKKRQR